MARRGVTGFPPPDDGKPNEGLEQMAMTKKEKARLAGILSSIERGLAYVDRPDTFLAVKASPLSPMTFKRSVTAGQVEHVIGKGDPLAYEGEQAIAVICKDIGSEFTLIRNARRELAAMLQGGQA